MTQGGLSFQQGLIIWAVVMALIAIIRLRRGAFGVGLVFAYIFNMWLMHWPAAAIYLLPWYRYHRPEEVRLGFEQSVYGIVAFGIGVVLLGPLLVTAWSALPKTAKTERGATFEMPRFLPLIYMALGMFSYTVLGRFGNVIPSLGAVSSALGLLLIIGFCLGCWQAWRRQNKIALTAWLISALILPLLTVVFMGFLGFGAIALAIVLLFTANLVGLRPTLIIAGILASYLGLSVYVTYMRDRVDIRASVWGGESLDRRISRVYESFNTFEWFDPNNRFHLWLIDERLNQNWLAGKAVQRLSSGSIEYAGGASLGNAVIALVPRAIWPDKPVRAGGNSFVTAYTGIGFAPGTTVGIGQVMEFYVNFGTAGVVVGFMLLGTAIMLFDRAAAQALAASDWQRLTVWFVAGLGFVQANGSLGEISASVGAGVVAALASNWFLRFFYKPKSAQPLMPVGRRDSRLQPALPQAGHGPRPRLDNRP